MFEISLIENYEKILQYFIEQSTHFAVMYPGDSTTYDGQNPLMFKKDFFLYLPQTNISSWNGMKDSIIISGVITSDVKKIFLDALNQKGIWNYSLFRNGKTILTVSDFDVGTIDISQEEMEILKERGVITPDNYL